MIVHTQSDSTHCVFLRLPIMLVAENPTCKPPDQHILFTFFLLRESIRNLLEPMRDPSWLAHARVSVQTRRAN